MLSQNEQELCSMLRLLPRQYLVIKDALIRESFRLGYLDKDMATQMIKIDVNKTSKCYDFFLRHGWIAAGAATAPAASAASSAAAASSAPASTTPKADGAGAAAAAAAAGD